MDTIYALSTTAGRAAVAVFRISGPGARSAMASLVSGVPPAPRRACLRPLRHPRTGEEIDRGVVMFFPEPRSFTGEDVVEFHVHGGRAVAKAMVEALAACTGLRPAEAGEFTRRAFERGKLDLTAAEGIADLVNAETEAQRRQSLRQLRGELGVLYESWRSELLRTLAHVEAYIDFPDEGLPAQLLEQSEIVLRRVSSEIRNHLDDNRRGERLRDGMMIAVLGPPNVGKSSLINNLSGRPAAIVSATAGTTRDVIEVQLDLAGYPVVLSDTAGLRDTIEEVEAEGVRRARERGREADIKLLMVDASDGGMPEPDLASFVDDDAYFVVNKCDLVSPLEISRICGRPAHGISALTGFGIEGLVKCLTDAVIERAGLTAAPALTRQRHRHALEDCLRALSRALAATECELLAEDLRLSVRAIGGITGRVDVEDLLDVIFRDFCIGK